MNQISVTVMRAAYGSGDTYDVRRANFTGMIIALGLHAAAVAMLLSYAPAREALANAVPLMVSLVTLPESKQETPPKPLPMKRLPQPRVTPPQHLLTTSQAPAAVSVPPQPVDAAPAPIAAAPTPPALPAPAAAPLPAPVTPPGFNADYLNNPAPEYPAISRRLGEQGRVVFRVYVEPDGLPSDVRLQTSSGFDRLDNVALAAIKRWKFVPARRGDAAVGGWVLVPLSFSLRS